MSEGFLKKAAGLFWESDSPPTPKPTEAPITAG